MRETDFYYFVLSKVYYYHDSFFFFVFFFYFPFLLNTFHMSLFIACVFHFCYAYDKHIRSVTDGYVYIPDTSMKRVKTPITDWEVPDPVFSPALLEPKTAFLMKYVLQCGLVPSIEEVQSHCQSEAVARQLELLDR